MNQPQTLALDIARKASSFTEEAQDDAINFLLDLEREAIATLDAIEKARSALAVARQDVKEVPPVFVWTLRLAVASDVVEDGFNPSTMAYLTASNLGRILAGHRETSGRLTVLTSPEPNSIKKAQRAPNPLDRDYRLEPKT
jgi:hypothetical protein